MTGDIGNSCMMHGVDDLVVQGDDPKLLISMPLEQVYIYYIGILVIYFSSFYSNYCVAFYMHSLIYTRCLALETDINLFGRHGDK